MQQLNECFFKMSNAVFSYGLTPIQFAVYSYLVSCSGHKEYCWPGIKRIAKNCSCSAGSVRNAISVLCERGFVKRTECFIDYSNGKTRQTTNMYYILNLPDKSCMEAGT